MITLRQVNKALQAAGATEELVRGEGYLYFTGGNVARWRGDNGERAPAQSVDNRTVG